MESPREVGKSKPMEAIFFNIIRLVHENDIWKEERSKIPSFDEEI